MGVVFSVFRRTDDGDYERILADLDEQIRNAEIRLSDIKLREKKTSVVFLVYSTLALLLYAGAYFLYLRVSDESTYSSLAKAAPLVGMPFFIYFFRNLSAFWYKRKKSNEKEHLENLRAKQKLKVEELKKKTAYYATRNLLERYDPSSRSKSGPVNPANMTPEQRRAAAMANLDQRTGRYPAQVEGMRQRTPQQRGLVTPGDATLSGGPNNPNSAASTPAAAYAYSPPTPASRTWVDRLIDAIVGEEGSTTKYALICERCHTHNGLVLAQELEEMQYFCPKCNHFNASRRKRRLRTSTLQPEMLHNPLMDTPTPTGSADPNADLQQSSQMLSAPSSRRYHRPSLPDLRVEDESDDAIEGARRRIGRAAISEHGASTEDEAEEQSDREPRPYDLLPQSLPGLRHDSVGETPEGSLGGEDFTEVAALSSEDNLNGEEGRTLRKKLSSDHADDVAEAEL